MKPAIPYILPALLLTLGSAQAQMAPAQAPPQQRSQQMPQREPQQMPQQAPPQQAPQSTPASAAQTTGCGGVANKAITAMNHADFDGASQSFDPAHKPPTEKLQQAWDSLTRQYGKPKTVGGATQGQITQGYTVVLVPMQFEKGQLGAEAACSAQGQLVMLRFGLMPDSGAAK